MVTDDGHDLQFGANVLGHFYFTQLVLPTLLSTAESSPDGIARVVNTASNGHYFSGLEYDTMKDGPARRKDGRWQPYRQSKTVRLFHLCHSFQSRRWYRQVKYRFFCRVERHTAGFLQSIVVRVLHHVSRCLASF